MDRPIDREVDSKRVEPPIQPNLFSEIVLEPG